MRIHTLHALKDNFIYVLEDDRGLCAVVDPGEAGPVLQFLKEKSLAASHILCTHHHHDHIGGAAALAAVYNCPVIGSLYDIPRLPPGSQGVREGQNLSLSGRTVEILEIPGHTLGQIAFYIPDAQAVFPGDTLFSAGCGRLFEGTAEQMFESLKKLKALPPETKIYFGHEYTVRNLEFVLAREERPEVREHLRISQEKLSHGEPTTPTDVATEMKINPFLRAGSAAEFAEWREARNHW